jgi:hypothetical protein
MITCKTVEGLMTDAQEGALSGFLGFRYRFHMSICPYCRRARRQLDRAVELAKEIPPQEAPVEVADAALTAFRARASKKE